MSLLRYISQIAFHPSKLVRSGSLWCFRSLPYPSVFRNHSSCVLRNINLFRTSCNLLQREYPLILLRKFCYPPSGFLRVFFRMLFAPNVTRRPLFLAEEWKNIPNVLTGNRTATLTGYHKNTIQKWIYHKK